MNILRFAKGKPCLFMTGNILDRLYVSIFDSHYILGRGYNVTKLLQIKLIERSYYVIYKYDKTLPITKARENLTNLVEVAHL